MEQVELKVKEDGSTQFEAIYSIFEEKSDNPGLEHIDFEEMNIAIWAALVHKTSGEARKTVNNRPGQRALRIHTCMEVVHRSVYDDPSGIQGEDFAP